MILVEQIPDAFSCPDFIGSSVEHHNISYSRACEWSVRVFLRTHLLLRFYDKSSGTAPLTFIVNGDTPVTKRLEYKEWQRKSKKRQAQRPLQCNCEEEGNVWLCFLLQPFNRTAKPVDHKVSSLLFSKSLRCIPPHVSFLGVCFVLASVFRGSPVRHVVAPSGEDIHVFQHDGTDAHRAQPGPTIVPAVAATKTNSMTPLDVHIAPKIKRQKYVVALLNHFSIWVIFEGSNRLTMVPFKDPFPCVKRRSLHAYLTQIFIHLRVRKTRPNLFCKLKIKKVIRAYYLLRMSAAAHS